MDFSMRLNDNKAGLYGLDKDRINAIIKEASEGSLYTKYQEKRASRIQERIQQQQDIISKLSAEQIRLSEQEMDRLAKQLEETRDLSRTIVHIDMDAFFAAVEMRDDPSLRNVPMAVGSTGMLSTSNYLARRFGVRAAMAGYIGKKLCPQLVIAPPNFQKYKSVSRVVRGVLAEYDPKFAAVGLDEAYLDITDCVKARKADQTQGLKRNHQRIRYGGECLCKLPRCELPQDEAKKTIEQCEKCGKQRVVVEDEVSFGHTVEEVTRELRFRIEQRTGLTASAGMAANKRLAKVCTDINKPNGQYYLLPVYDVIIDFVRELPIRKICGIGGVTEALLKAVGVETCKDLYDKRGLLALVHSSMSAKWFLRVAMGVGSSTVDGGSYTDSDRKSISVERTFSSTSDTEKLLSLCRQLCERLVEDMARKELRAKTVTVKMKTVEFEIRTRATTLDNYICDFEPIYNVAKKTLLDEISAAKPGQLCLRLLGVRLSSFLHETEAHRLKLPDITRYLRKSSRGAGATTSAASSLHVGNSVEDEDSVDSTTCAEVMGNDEDDVMVVSDEDSADDEQKPTTSAVTITIDGASFSSDVGGRVDVEESDAGKNLEYFSTVCPVCNSRLTHSNWDTVNAHLDRCLNRKTISGIIKEQDQELTGAQRIPDREAEKRKTKTPGKSGEKKLRTGRLPVTPPTPGMKRIDEYFKKTV